MSWKRIEQKENLLLTEIKRLSEEVDELSFFREEVSKLKELMFVCGFNTTATV